MPLPDTAIRNAKPRLKPGRMFGEKDLHLEIWPKGGKWWRPRWACPGRVKLRAKQPPATAIGPSGAFNFSALDARLRGKERVNFLLCSSVPEIIMIEGAGVSGTYISFGPALAPTHIALVPTPHR
jgi:hypothetical protein